MTDLQLQFKAYQHILKSRNRQSSNAVHSLISNLFKKFPSYLHTNLVFIGHNSRWQVISEYPVNGTRTFGKRQFQTLVNGQAKGLKWMVLVGPHRDSVMWVGASSTDPVEHLQVSRIRKPNLFTEVHRAGRKQVLLLVSCKVGREDNKSLWPTLASSMEPVPWLRDGLLDQLAQSLSEKK